MPHHQWDKVTQITRAKYKCGFCNSITAPDRGYQAHQSQGDLGVIIICPNCTRPTYFDDTRQQHPRVRFGNNVNAITDKGVESLYDEARQCTSVGSYTGAVLCCRKLLMNIAVQHGAQEGLQFIKYVDYLESNGFIPPNGKGWVDQIRQKGNEATHEIRIMTEQEAQQLLHFSEMLLKFIYEFPAMLTP